MRKFSAYQYKQANACTSAVLPNAICFSAGDRIVVHKESKRSMFSIPHALSTPPLRTYKFNEIVSSINWSCFEENG